MATATRTLIPEGTIFDRLTVVAFAGVRNRYRTYLCACRCGATTTVKGTSLRNGHTRSCGCRQRDWANSGEARRITGISQSPTANTYWSMLKRCYDPRTVGFENYGGRGITVCVRWRESFTNFVEDMGERPADRTLDRIDNEGNYEPTNCRWATRVEQRHNRRHPCKKGDA